VNVTPLEPEWEGHVTLEFSNTTNLPARIYAGEGVAQMLFLKVMKYVKLHIKTVVVNTKVKQV
jgi:deoxycytidine triphosphate deaminase